MDNSKDWGEFLEGIKAAQQAAEAQKEANEVSPDEDILENGFSRQVTFYEKD